MKPSENHIYREALITGMELGVKSTLDTATIAMDQLVRDSAMLEGLPASEVLRIAALSMDETLKDIMGQWLEDSKKHVIEHYRESR